MLLKNSCAWVNQTASDENELPSKHVAAGCHAGEKLLRVVNQTAGSDNNELVISTDRSHVPCC
jgi:hypothetical protein